jgi:dTDP-4-dehydrorhamnose 3,5-epimerase-like enzyme
LGILGQKSLQSIAHPRSRKVLHQFLCRSDRHNLPTNRRMKDDMQQANASFSKPQTVEGLFSEQHAAPANAVLVSLPSGGRELGSPH